MAAHRLFLAIPVPGEISLAVTGSLASLRELKGVRLVPAANYHITVHFFGSVAEEKISLLTRDVAEKVRGQRRFVLTAEKLQLFFKRKHGMIWVRFSAAEDFDELCGKIQQIANEQAKEQMAHITCARLKPDALSGISLRLPEIQQYEIPVDHIELWKSADGKEGVKYTSIASFAFD